MMIIDSLIYCTLAWYIENVHPGMSYLYIYFKIYFDFTFKWLYKTLQEMSQYT